MIRALLERFTSRMRPRVIYDREGGAPYLSRYYLLGAPHMADGSSPLTPEGNPKPNAIFPNGLGVYLHKFHKSDQDQATHSHPWSWAFSLILAGGYSEERQFGTRITRRDVKPGRLIRILESDFHRVDLLEHDSWSLFIAGPKVSSWGFKDRDTGEYYPWREFIARVRGPGWDDSVGRNYACQGLTCKAHTAFEARDWFAHKLGVPDRQTLRVEQVAS